MYYSAFFLLKFTIQLNVLKGEMYIFLIKNEGKIFGTYFIFGLNKQEI